MEPALHVNTPQELKTSRSAAAMAMLSIIAPIEAPVV